MGSLKLIDEKTKDEIFVSKSKLLKYDDEYELPNEIAIGFKNYIKYGKTKKK